MTRAKTDQECLLQAIINNPKDAAPRLAYADWLDENGMEEYAEFVRRDVGDVYCHGYVRNLCLPRFYHGLRLFGWDLNGVSCYTPEKSWPNIQRIDLIFDRGFVREVRAPIELFEKFGPTLALTNPVENWVITDRDVRVFNNEYHWWACNTSRLIDRILNGSSGENFLRFDLPHGIFKHLSLGKLSYYKSFRKYTCPEDAHKDLQNACGKYARES